MNTPPDPAFIAFDGDRRIAAGDLREVARAAKQALDRHSDISVLIFDGLTSQPVDLDFRGSVECRHFQDAVPGKKILYVLSSDVASNIHDWFVIHREGYEPPGPPQFDFFTTWHRVGFFGASELSGQAWTVYSARGPNAGADSPKTK